MCSKLTPCYDLTDEEGRGRNVKNIIFVWKELCSKYTSSGRDLRTLILLNRDGKAIIKFNIQDWVSFGHLLNTV